VRGFFAERLSVVSGAADIFHEVKAKLPILSREVYVQRQVERAWPSGEWMDNELDRLGTPGQGAALPGEGIQADDGHLDRSAGSIPAPSPPSITSAERVTQSVTIIGGTKYDEDAFRQYLDNLPEVTGLIVGEGRGGESKAVEIWGSARFVPLDKDRYGKLARKVNVEQVLSYDVSSPVVLVGNGERVKQARDWLKRANWDREVIELP
jgi:hypothetical protein